jgi:hypothetical protein
MSILDLHAKLEGIIGDGLLRDLTHWNTIIDQLGEGDASANYVALRERYAMVSLLSSKLRAQLN